MYYVEAEVETGNESNRVENGGESQGAAALSRFFAGTMRIEKISAVTFRVLNMKASVRFYGDVLGMDVLYGGEDTPFSSLRPKDAKYPILNFGTGSFGCWLGADDFLRGGPGCVLGVPAGKRI